MCEVTAANFDSIFPKLERVLKAARFVSVDLEFSCLNASSKSQSSLFDSPKERYRKLRDTVQQMSPLQIGLTAFTFIPDAYSYDAHVYNFYLYPRSLFLHDVTFLCQTSSLDFLTRHNFDFNKCIKEGVSYLNRPQEESLLKFLQNKDFISDLDLFPEEDALFKNYISQAQTWSSSTPENDQDDSLVLSTKGQTNEFRYYLHYELDSLFKNTAFVSVDKNHNLKLTRRHLSDKIETKNIAIAELYLQNLLGFTRVFRLLTALKIPLVGHNILQDLLVLVDKFEQPLPESYGDFKRLAHSLFPAVYDTKNICFKLRSKLPNNKKFYQTTLEGLYVYFRDKEGRHMVVPSSPLIEPVAAEELVRQFHHAGWDSYCTGYIFVRMAHVFAAWDNSNKKKKFMSRELMVAVEQYKNCINVIKGDLSNIRLDRDDPPSTRPPKLVVTSIASHPINLKKMAFLLEPCGFVEIKPLSYRNHSAIIAVDNFGSVNRILRQFSDHPEYSIQNYSVFRHSYLARTFMWSTFFVSGVALAWYGFKKIN